MEIGDRVGAIRDATKEIVNLYGYGIYEGHEVPPAEASGLLHEIGVPNPKIKLDNGSIIWGCQCWWGPEEKIKEIIEDRKVNIVPVEKFKK